MAKKTKCVTVTQKGFIMHENDIFTEISEQLQLEKTYGKTYRAYAADIVKQIMTYAEKTPKASLINFTTKVLVEALHQITEDKNECNINNVSAKWKKIQNYAMCSECGHKVNWGSKDFLSPYCPHCGAKMKGKENHE